MIVVRSALNDRCAERQNKLCEGDQVELTTSSISWVRV